MGFKKFKMTEPIKSRILDDLVIQLDKLICEKTADLSQRTQHRYGMLFDDEQDAENRAIIQYQRDEIFNLNSTRRALLIGIRNGSDSS